MKLLKYVMTHDSGLAPNPFFGVCSLAVCTPNHVNARLTPGDWVVGHSCKGTGYRLVYAMQLTKVVGMDDYFKQFPKKHPNPYGNIEQQYGDNMYFRDGGYWKRLPSAQHNEVSRFKHDQNRNVYLAEGPEHFWYFGADNAMPVLAEAMDRFPWLIRAGRGIQYIEDSALIDAFSQWLVALGFSGLLGKPRDQQICFPPRYLISIDPEPVWRDAEFGGSDGSGRVASSCARQPLRSKKGKPSC